MTRKRRLLSKNEYKTVDDRMLWRLADNWKQQVEKDVKCKKKVSKRRSLKKIRVFQPMQCVFSTHDDSVTGWEEEMREKKVCFDLSHEKCFITWGEPIRIVKTSFSLIATGVNEIFSKEKWKVCGKILSCGHHWIRWLDLLLLIKSFTILKTNSLNVSLNNHLNISF